MAQKKHWYTETCVICGTTENLTRDHVVPRWFSLGVKHFGFRMRKANFKDKALFFKEDGSKHYKYQTMCEKCNHFKGGIIDYSNPLVRGYVRYFIETVQEILDEHEK